MHREEKRRKFHEALLNMLYPSPSSPPSEDGEEEETPNALPDSSSLDPIVVDELGESRASSSSSDDGGERGPEKLTRAQRKRLRKKKLKESASSRRKIIGPLLPAAADNDCQDDPEKNFKVLDKLPLRSQTHQELQPTRASSRKSKWLPELCNLKASSKNLNAPRTDIMTTRVC